MRSLISPSLQSALEAQALEEGLLSRDDYSYGELYDVPAALRSIKDHKKILPYLCLFPNVEGTESEFDNRKLASRIGMEFEPVSVRGIRSQFFKQKSADGEGSIEAFMYECHSRAFATFESQRDQILPIVFAHMSKEWNSPSATRHRQLNFYTESFAIREAALHAVDMMAQWYATDLASPMWRYDTRAEQRLADWSGLPRNLIAEPDFELWLDKLDDFYVRHFATIFWSGVNERALSIQGEGRTAASQSVEVKKKAAETAALLSINFRDELRVVPDPRSLAEAIEMAHSTEMSRLREKIFEWISIAGQSDASLDQRIRRDIAKASAELRRLRSYRELNSSPWFFTAKFLTAQVPLVSNVASVIEYGLTWYEKWATEKNVWVAIR
ncbi:hypothetical protein [Rhizobium sp. R86522]|uniref:hypothetical protein n=1 Tax=Rhizobium sp. R86522 TaxID=3093861 RepID=UPI00366A8668